MALRTKQQICDEILIEVYGGQYSNDVSISLAFVCRKLNNRIAESAVKSAFGSNNLDMVVEADDVFRIRYTGLSLSTDSITGLKYIPMPAQPVGLPSMRSFSVFPPAMFGGRASTLFKPIFASEVDRIRSQPKIRKVFYFQENGNLYFIDSFQIMSAYSSINMSLVTGGANNLTDMLNLPDDEIARIKSIIVPELKNMILLRDTDALPPADEPAPRQGK